MAAKVYVETTIPSYLAARPSRDLITAAHQQITNEWWQTRRSGFDLFVSELVLQEAALGDPELIQRRLGFLSGIPKLAITEPAQELARALLRPGLLPPNAAADALHISVAAANGMDYLLTWNIRHLANATLRRGIDEACRARGWVAPVVCTPEELLEG